MQFPKIEKKNFLLRITVILVLFLVFFRVLKASALSRTFSFLICCRQGCKFSNFFRGGAEHGGRKISALRRSGAEKFLLVAEIRLDCNPLWRKSAMAEKKPLRRKSAVAEKSLWRKQNRCGGKKPLWRKKNRCCRKLPWRKNRCGGKTIAVAEKKTLWRKTAVAEKSLWRLN